MTSGGDTREDVAAELVLGERCRISVEILLGEPQITVIAMAGARHGIAQRQMLRETLHGRIRMRRIVDRIDVVRPDVGPKRVGWH